MSVATGRLADPDVLGDELLQARPLCHLQHRRKTGARHEVRVIERGGGTLASRGCPSARVELSL